MNTEKSKSVVDTEGRILKDVSEKIEVVCQTCKGRGEIPDPKARNNGKTYFGGYPMIECRTCNGEGWVITNQ